MTVPTPQAEALRLALAALESCKPADTSSGHLIHPSFDEKAVSAAIEAVEHALTTRAPDAGWQPIESAPKDGTLIVLGASKGVWLGKYKPVYTSGYQPQNPWASMMLNHDHMAERYTRPTHWRPLPAPPAPEALEVKHG